MLDHGLERHHMDSVALLITLALTFTLAVVSARQLLGGVLYIMAKNTGGVRPAAQASTSDTQTAAS